MEVNHKEMIDKNYMLFCELLRLKSIHLIRYLYDEQVLTEHAATKTMSQSAHTLRAIHLLDNMMKLGSDAFNSLYAAILYTKLWKAADLLEPGKRPHQAIEEEEQIPLPEIWPDEAYFKELENKELEINKVDPKDERMKEWYEESRKNNIYDLRQRVKGRALIINNHKFDKQSARAGSLKDVEGLQKIFQGLGFEVDSHSDQSCQDMQELLRKECKRDHTDYNCFFLILMSHGHKGVVYGTDGYKEGESFRNSLNIEEIKNQFSEVKSLERKPKVFIIQACQGSGKDRGIDQKQRADEDDEEEEEEEPANDPKNDVPPDDKTKVDGGTNQAPDEEDNGGENALAGDDASGPDSDSDEDEEESEEDKRRREEERDMGDSITAEAPFHFLVAMATTEGNLSYRNTLYGSWFIQAFIFVLANYAWKEDLLTLMEKVNELVRRAKTEKTKRSTKHYLQVSQITNTFIKRFFFFPGMPLESPGKTKKPPMNLGAMPGLSA